MSAWSEFLTHPALNCRHLLEAALVTLLRSLAPAMVALIAGRIFRDREPRARARIYAIGFGCTLLLMLAALLPLKSSRGLLDVSLPAANQDAEIVQAPPARPRSEFAGFLHTPSVSAPRRVKEVPAAPGPSLTAEAPLPPAHPAPTPWLYPVLASTWAAGTLLLLAWLGLGQCRAFLLRRKALPVQSPDLKATLDSLCRKLKIPPPELLVTAESASPFVMGLRRPCILVPEYLLRTKDSSTVRAVLAHELHHIASCDIAWTLMGKLICAFLWPQPILWALKRQWLAATEEACDRAALRQNCSPQKYARYLVEIADSYRHGVPKATAGLGMAHSRSTLGRRIEQILNDSVREVPRMSSVSLRALLCVSTIFVFAACRIVSAQHSEPAATVNAPHAPLPAIPSTDQEKADDAKARQEKLSAERKSLEDAKRELGRQRVAMQRSADDRRRAEMESIDMRAHIAALEDQQRTLENTKKLRGADAAKRTSDADRMAAKRAAEVRKMAEVAAANQDQDVARLQAEKRAAEQAYERLRRDTASASEDKALAEEQRLQSGKLDILNGELTKREILLLDMERKYAANHPAVAGTKADIETLRKRIEDMAAQNRDMEQKRAMIAQKAAEQELNRVAKAQDELAAAQQKSLRDNKLQVDRDVLLAQQARQNAENTALRQQLAKLKAEIAALQDRLAASEKKRK